jgi:hypothetical protein
VIVPWGFGSIAAVADVRTTGVGAAADATFDRCGVKAHPP